MILIHPRRFATMLDNAVLFAKEGKGNERGVIVETTPEQLLVTGVGQHGIVTDAEPHSDHWLDSRVLLPASDVTELAKVVRSVPDAGKQGTEVAVTIIMTQEYGEVLRVAQGADIIAELATDERLTPILSVLDTARGVQTSTSGGDVYTASILALVGRLKPLGERDRAVLHHKTVGDSTQFTFGTCIGFIEANRTPPGALL